MKGIQKSAVEIDGWASLKAYTDARIALGKTGVSIPLKESLAFKLAHAHAKDAVYSSLDKDALREALAALSLPIYCLESQASTRDTYLQRPDLGRKLSADSARILQQHEGPPADLSIILADGLSATALNQNALPVVQLLIEKAGQIGYSIAPLCLVEQGRVAIADEIGSLLKAKLTIILIGERPGLSSFDSLGAYLTYAPAPGLTDERRNCISNIRPQGLSPLLAVDKMLYLIHQAFHLQLSGVQLKDKDRNSDAPLSISGLDTDIAE
jgi:ethanolamine ammonia-lyase small subunit